MPRYSYSPLATDPGLPAHSGHSSVDTSDNFTKKRDLCLGFLILSAIVYVLARAGSGNCSPGGEFTLSSTSSSAFDIGAYSEKIL